MPLLTWLRARLTKPAPQAGQTTPVAPPPKPATAATPHQPDNMVRMHIAASDPEFPALRDAAIAQIIAAIDSVAQQHGFVKKPRSWAQSGPLGTISIQLQRSRFGFDCGINLGWLPLSDAAPGPWMLDNVVPLGDFMPQDATLSNDPGTLVYLDVHAHPVHLETAMDVLNTRALPWLTAHLTDANAPLAPMA
jgi:hypothetical protein